MFVQRGGKLSGKVIFFIWIFIAGRDVTGCEPRGENINMNIEESVFESSVVDLSKLEIYGFKKNGGKWVYNSLFMSDAFKAVVMVDEKGVVSGNVYDVESNDVYIPLRVEEMAVGYAGKVRAAYQKILLDIREHCCQDSYFISAQANRLAEKIYAQYADKPLFLWEKFKNCAVFRNPDNCKWYAIIMNIDKNKLDKMQSGKVEVVNFKLNKARVQSLLQLKGFYPAYHMNKSNWITVALDGTVGDDVLGSLLNESHLFTENKKV